MAKGTEPITYVYDFEGHVIEVSREHVGSAYARNGNVGNPTEYFVWSATVDGKWVTSGCHQRAEAYEYGRASVLGIEYRMQRSDYDHRGINERPFSKVRDEMKANYRSRRSGADGKTTIRH